MIQTRRAQRSFGDGLIAEEVRDLHEAWMKHADQSLPRRRPGCSYCLTGECSRDVKRCLTKRAPVASLILWLRRGSFF